MTWTCFHKRSLKHRLTWDTLLHTPMQVLFVHHLLIQIVHKHTKILYLDQIWSMNLKSRDFTIYFGHIILGNFLMNENMTSSFKKRKSSMHTKRLMKYWLYLISKRGTNLNTWKCGLIMRKYRKMPACLVKKDEFRVRQTWIHIQALSFHSWVTFAKLITRPELLFLTL